MPDDRAFKKRIIQLNPDLNMTLSKPQDCEKIFCRCSKLEEVKVRPINTKPISSYECKVKVNEFFSHYEGLKGYNLRLEICRNKESERLVVVFDYGRNSEGSPI